MVKSFYQVFKITLKELLKNTSIDGLKFLVIQTNLKFQKRIWYIILLLTTIFSIYVVYFAWIGFTSNPTITTLESQMYPIWNVPFPGVAICSINKMSKKAVQEYAHVLNIKMGNFTKEEELQSKILLLGSLLDPTSVDPDEAINFQDILDYYDTDKKLGYYDVKTTMHMLSPKCKDLLLKCRWKGEEMNCSKLFYTGLTSDSYCCVFNYARLSQFHNDTNIIKTNATGAFNGLTVLLNATTEDYFYTNKNTIGFSIQLFNAKNFPDGTTGNFKEYILNPAHEVFMKLIVTTLISQDSIRPYGTGQRNCYFANEKKDEYGNFYSYPDCLTKCKLRSIRALCNCVPFYAPYHFAIDYPPNEVCTLAHVACLQRYKVTWNTYKPQEKDIKGFEREQEDSLSCPSCLPLCSNTVYNFEATSSIIHPNGYQQATWGLMKDINNFTDVSLLRIYFATTSSLLYKKDVLFTWYEIIGNFGGLLSLCIGCSILSFIEILYFMIVKFAENWIKENKIKKENRIWKFKKFFTRETKQPPTAFPYLE